VNKIFSALLASLICVNSCNAAPSKQIIGYYTDWDTYGRNFQPEQIQMNDLTTVIYAFAQVGNCAAPFATDGQPTLCNEGGYATGVQDYKLHAIDPYSDFVVIPAGYKHEGDSWNKGNMTKVINLAHNQNKTALLSIGGYTLSVALTTAMDNSHRGVLIQSILDFLKVVENDNKNAAAGKNKTFDGVDIDWEPNWEITTPEQIQNYAVFLQELRIALKKWNPNAQLTIATWANPNVVNHISAANWQTISNAVDNINVMTYDYHGGFDFPKITNLLAPLHFDPNQPDESVGKNIFNIESTLQAYLAQGVPANKIVLGIPAYGRAVKGVANVAPVGLPNAKGLYQSFSYVPQGEWDGDGMFDYKYILGKMLGKDGGFTDYEVAGTVAAYNPASGIFISYDNVDTLLQKINFVKSNNLAGVMFWSLSGDLDSSDSNYQKSSLVHNAKVKFFSIFIQH
jgi:chitinase